MQRVKLLGLVVMATLGLSAVVAGSAFGVEILNKRGEATENITFSGTSKKETQFSILKGFGVTKCSEVETQGAQEGKSLLGTMHLNFKGCTTNLAGTCTGLGDAAGTILSLGIFHIYKDIVPGELVLLILVEHLHYLCEGGFVPKTLVLVSGMVICLFGPVGVLTTKVKVTCLKGKERGDPGDTAYINAEGKEVKLGEEGLLASENEGALTMSAEEGEGESTLSEEAELMG